MWKSGKTFKNQLYVDLTESDDEQLGVGDSEQELNKQFYAESWRG
ncbi:MAG: hypothetical protein ACE5IY_21135 [bacterium]